MARNERSDSGYVEAFGALSLGSQCKQIDYELKSLVARRTQRIAIIISLELGHLVALKTGQMIWAVELYKY